MKNIKKIKNIYKTKKILPKPKWIKINTIKNINKIQNMKNILRKNSLYTVCEESLCPNLFECFSKNIATFMILGNICTRKCKFCNIKKGRPNKLNKKEPIKIAKTIMHLKLKYVVITSVNRDDLKDGGAKQFSECIKNIRKINKSIKIEILVPDFRNKQKIALKIINKYPPNIFNHNIENIPRLYKKILPQSNYQSSLKLLEKFKRNNPNIPTKSGLILGMGETKKEIINVMKDLYNHGVTILTIGQYLQPNKNNLPVKKYITKKEFDDLKKEAKKIGFSYIASGPFIRSSYKAQIQINYLH